MITKKSEMMKRKLLKQISIFVSCFSLIGCYEDKSSLDTNPLPEVKIEIPGVSETVRVGYNEPLIIDTKIVKEGVENHPDLEYKWKISVTKELDDFELLSEEADLNKVISLPISVDPYGMIFTVKDKKSNFEYNKYFKVYVSSSYGEGILVAYTEDGTTSDLALIMDTPITNDYNKSAPNIRKGLYSIANNAPMPGLVKQSCYSKQSEKTPVYWFSFADGSYQNVGCEAYRRIDADMIFQPAGFKAFTFFNTHQYVVMFATSGVYRMNKQNDRRPSMPVLTTVAGGVPSNNVASIDNSHKSNDPSVVFYNESVGAFYYGTNLFSTFSKYGTPTIQDAPFDWSNLPNKECQAAGKSFDGKTHALLMRDKGTNNYAIYGIRQSEYTPEGYSASYPKSVIDVPTAANAMINSAVSIFFMTDYPVMFVVTSTGVYTVNFATSPALFNTTSQYTPAAGETIIVAKMYQQGSYTNNRDDNTSLYGGEPAVKVHPLNNKAIYFATVKSGTQGTVYIIPMVPTQVSSGILETNVSKIIKYEGFSRILDISTQGI